MGWGVCLSVKQTLSSYGLETRPSSGLFCLLHSTVAGSDDVLPQNAPKSFVGQRNLRQIVFYIPLWGGVSVSQKLATFAETLSWIGE